MPSSAGTPAAAAAYSSSSGSYVAVATHQLTSQQSTMPGSLVPVFTPCGGGGYEWPGSLGDGELRGRAPAARAVASGGGVGAAARALWAWIGKGRKAAVTMSRSASSRKDRLYGQEEYAQNFDEGAAAGEPENLARSFSSRYARRAAPWDGAR